MPAYTIITRRAAVYDEQGYLTTRGVQVCDHGDTISIGATEHAKDDLDIDLEACEITSKIAGWEVQW